MHDLYREHILEHYKHPQNYGHLKKSDGSIDDLNSTCGDKIHLEIQYKGNKISDIVFEGSGCAISMASASLLTDAVKGKTKKQIEKLTYQDIYNLLEIEVSPARANCALLPLAALKKLIQKK